MSLCWFPNENAWQADNYGFSLSIYNKTFINIAELKIKKTKQNKKQLEPLCRWNDTNPAGIFYNITQRIYCAINLKIKISPQMAPGWHLTLIEGFKQMHIYESNFHAM